MRNAQTTAAMAITGIIAASALAACGASGADGGSAEQVTIGTHPVGTAYYNGGTALASLISDHTDLRASVQPFAGPNAWMPALAKGQVTFGLSGAVDPVWAYQGAHGYEKTPEVRLVAESGDLFVVGLVTREDSGIETLADMRGAKVAAGYGGNVAAEQARVAMMRSAGLTDDDVKLVPVPDVTSSMDALRNGQVDVAFGLAPTTPAGVDVDAATPLRALSFGDLSPDEISDGTPEDLVPILEEELPGWDAAVIPAGTGYVEDDVVGLGYAIELVTSEDTSDEMVTDVLDAISENHEELAEADPTARFTPESIEVEEFFVPFHPAAVEWLEANSNWGEDQQARQEELLG